ncbi:10143_t:CDS:1, partial [Racocetra persica]
ELSAYYNGEAAGPPFLSTNFKSEGDRRKVIRFLLRCIEFS